MRLTKQTNYAIRILVLCARAEGALVKVGDIAQALDISLQNTFKSVHLLTKAGFLAPVRGRNGGVGLARPPREIRVSDVVRAVEFLEESAPAARKGAGGQKSPIPIGQVIDAAFAAFLSVLDEHTLDDLARPGPTRPVPRSRPRQRSRNAAAGSRAWRRAL